MDGLFLFHGNGSSKFCGGVFTKKNIAEKWIAQYKLTGILTKYPVDISVYDWAIENSIMTPKRDYQFKPEYIGGFTHASQEHYHYENGKCLNCDEQD